MPRRQRELAVPDAFPSRSLVASATRYDGKTARIYNNDQGTWQAECYRHYRICGEARFAAAFFGHALSKTELYIPVNNTDRRAPRATAGAAVDLLDELFNGADGQSQMLSAIGFHFTIAGECYLIGRHIPSDTGDMEVWEIRSVLEVTCNGSGKNAQWRIHTGGGQPDILLTEDDVVIRLWQPDPANAFQADSPFKSVLPILEEIEWLTRYIFAQCSSRLAGAGVWLVPEEIDFPPPPDSDDPEKAANRNTADSLMATLGDAMLKPLDDPGSPAAKVPIVMTAPGDMIGNQQWITFWSELDTEAKSLRQEAIQRFALGMDLPPERILGMSAGAGAGGGGQRGISHWGAWQIDEDTIKMHVEPMLDVVVNALTIAYIRPGLKDPNAMPVRYDTSSLRLRPDRSAESLELYDRGLIKAEVVVQENGFDASEMMDPDERKLWLTVKVASGSATPDMVSEALKILGVDLPVGPDNYVDPNQSRPDPSLEDHPSNDLPEQGYSTILAACDALVYRALERAGNRIRQSGTKPPGLKSFEVHTATTLTPSQATEALTDAWTCAPMVLDGVAADPEAVLKSLHSYTAGLLMTSQPHTRDALAKWMATTA